MSQPFKRLERVLRLEMKQGYQDKAVVGGIRQFVTFWIDQARAAVTEEADKALIEQVAEVLNQYHRLPGVEARADKIDNLMAKLDYRRQRVQGNKAKNEHHPSSTKRWTPPKQQPSSRRAPEAPTAPPAATPPPAKPDAPRPTVVADPARLQEPVTAVKGVGPKTAELLHRLGAETAQDLLYLMPRRFNDYTLMKSINQINYGETLTIIGTVWEVRSRKTRNNQVIIQAVISDGTGTVQASWFNQTWLVEQLKPNSQIVISGTVEQFLGRPIFNNPQWEPLAFEPLKTRRIVPIYPLTKGLSETKMRDIMRKAVTQYSDHIVDPLPDKIRSKHQLLPLGEAIRQQHFPQDQQLLHQARQRLAFDELFLLQLGMFSQRQDWLANPSLALPLEANSMQKYYQSLPFELTTAQKRVIAEVGRDLGETVPMNRLLQGDVGAGKTAVAAAALLMAIQAGAQAALMAPTSILAEQHYQSLQKMLAPFSFEIRLLTGNVTAKEKEEVYAALAAGDVQLVIGTHALIQEGVAFAKLGLVVIDEQHRFGVDQRQALRAKGPIIYDQQHHPHLLVMSATPIPRTLALTLYGNLDISILDEMPPGRQEIKTRWLPTRERERAYAFVRGQVKEGRQAYMVYPLVEESDSLDVKAAVTEYERLSQKIFPDLRVGLIHGKLANAEKEAVMASFKAGEIDILVATAVIEVGVDVPNSTVMVIDEANRFGLAQLHQFRGRVGRGQHQSYCLLIADSIGGDSQERLTALEETNDGFILAEKDLEIRGPGEFFGRQQSGLPELQLATLSDVSILEKARAEAETIFDIDPTLSLPDHQPLAQRLAQFWQQAGDIS
ncbi:MAG TPA: ATP-dependent DNA helicase RecG [Anaerolineae bacterium]|nr:ATP-dependent DNA helicase RecG [Anaerolineae bacterium]